MKLVTDYLPINIIRLAFFIFGYVILFSENVSYINITIIIALFFSIVWLLLDLSGITNPDKIPYISLFPTFLDILLITLFTYISGNVNSFIIGAYFYVIAIGSMNKRIPHGLFAVLLSILLFSIMTILCYFSIIPRMNLLGGGSEISLKQNIGGIIFFSIMALAIYKVISSLIKIEIKLNTELSEEKNKVEDLLHAILPKKIVQEIKDTGTCVPVKKENVTVLFTDFVNFTKITEDINPVDLINILDHYFSSFDKILESYGIEKLKTMGDGYMCVAGVPDDLFYNSKVMAKAALEIIKFVKEEKKIRQNNKQTFFDIRIGIHSGSVYAGIIGKSKFSYDIWGDVVNLASRLETSGEPNTINISKEVYNEISNEKMNITFRGKIEAKNKGLVDMYKIEL